MSTQSTKKVFKCKEHFNSVSDKMTKLYEDQKFFDVTLVSGIDQTKFKAHRIILSLWSEYFNAMFSNPLKESNAEEIVLNNIDGETLKTIIDFMYYGSIEMSSDTIQNLSEAANFLNISTLEAGCCEFMKEQLEPANCLGIGSFAENLNYDPLFKHSYEFACKNFEQVRLEEEFLKVSEDFLCKLLSSDDLVAKSEENVFHSIVAWVEHDRNNREKLLPKLLSLIRFQNLEPEFILRSRSLVCMSTELYEIIFTWLEWHFSPENRNMEGIKERNSVAVN